MRVIIAGSRTVKDYKTVCDAVEKSGFQISQVISGNAGGVDKLGERWAKDKKVSLKVMPAEWLKYGKSAGYKRNEQMALLADACIVIWDGESRGSQHMINIAKDKGLKLFVLNLKETDD